MSFMTVREIAEFLQGELKGDGDTEIRSVAGIAQASEHDITYVSSPKYLRHLHGSRAACIIVQEFVDGTSCSQIKVPNPQYAFARLLERIYPAEAPASGIDARSFIAPTAVVGQHVTVFPFVYISEGAKIGDNSLLYPGVYVGRGSTIGSGCTIHANVSIREGVSIGNRVTIHAGTVIGADGFGYVFEQGTQYKIPQVGGVIIEDDVEIGANVSIDRATLDNTVIGAGTKIDNQCQIGHNVKIGKHCLLVAQVAIGGSTEIGDYVILAGQVGVADHTTVESGTIIAAQSGIAGHIEKGLYAGSPAIPHKTWLRAQALYGKLPELQKQIKALEARIKEIEKGNPS